tara:strand:+ start:915 stop:1247 length:333 start_codon:yes stop_codon:yes gene_type:complete
MAPQPLPTSQLQRLHSCTGTAIFTIVPEGTNAVIKSINLANARALAAGAALFDLYIENGGTKFYILRNHSLAEGSRLFIDFKDIHFNNIQNQDALVLGVQVGIVDVIIST